MRLQIARPRPDAGAGRAVGVVCAPRANGSKIARALVGRDARAAILDGDPRAGADGRR